jgi:metal-dependent amidase/aminoacylase/carboxypeptidase family protein
MCLNARRRLSHGAAAMYGASVELRLMGAATSSAPSPAWVDYLREQAARCPAWNRLSIVCRPGGSEDATLMMARVQQRGGLASYGFWHGTERRSPQRKIRLRRERDDHRRRNAGATALNFPCSEVCNGGPLPLVDEVITARAGELTAIADAIWDHPETRFEEFWSAERLALALEAEGFQV